MYEATRVLNISNLSFQHTSLHTPGIAFSLSLGIPQFVVVDRKVVSETSWAVCATKLFSHHRTSKDKHTQFTY